MSRLRLSILTLLLAALACNTPEPISDALPAPKESSAFPSSTDLHTPRPARSPTYTPRPDPLGSTATPQARGVFRVAILVDLSSEPVERTLAEQALREASGTLYEHTGFVFELVDFVEMSPTEGAQREQLVDQYIETHLNGLPDGILFYTWGTDNVTTIHGGYSSQISVPEPAFRNHFRNVQGDEDRIYVANNHWSHRYAQCGYGDATLKEPVSEVSIEGECRNQPGTACVDQYGYSMCSNAVDDLYASTSTFFAASSILHEFMHPFGLHGNGDHYGTEICKEIMGWDSSTWTFELADAQRFAGMCPHAYGNFVAGH